jgi:hypothetical protein
VSTHWSVLKSYQSEWINLSSHLLYLNGDDILKYNSNSNLNRQIKFNLSTFKF